LPETGRSSRGRRSSADKFEKIDEAKLLRALEDPDYAAGLNRSGRFLKEELLRTKNYASVGKFLTVLPENDVKSLMKEWVIGTLTGLGAVRDYDEQRWLTEDLGLSNDLRLTDRLYYEAGGRAFPELASHDTGHMKEAMIDWLRRKNEAASTGPWIDLISDPTLKAKLSKVEPWIRPSDFLDGPERAVQSSMINNPMKSTGINRKPHGKYKEPA
jgi:hypothetical protein